MSGTPELACPACASPRLAGWFTHAAPSGSFRLARCPACRSAFVLPRPSHETIEKVYQAAEYQRNDSDSPDERYRRLQAEEAIYPNSTLDAVRVVAHCRALARGKRFLDVGAGMGFFSREARRNGFAVTALEPSPRSREVFSLMNGFEPEPSMLTPGFVARHEGGFDVVLMSQILEHLLDLPETLAQLRTLLSPDGVAAIAVPHFRSAVSLVQGKRDMFIIPPEHLNFFTRNGLRALFERHGFVLERAETISRFDQRRLAGRIPIRPVAGLAGALMRATLRVADRLDLGMYLNCYFRRKGSL